MNIMTQFAEANAASGGIFTALGIDWKMLIFQIVAFVILVVLLGKFVYPILIKTVDARHAEIEAGTKAAEEAEKKAHEANKNIEKLLKQARTEASDIIATAKEEAAAAIESAEQKSKVRAEHIVSEAHAQLEKDIVAAKRMLHNETLGLVAEATEKIVGKTISAKVDENVIAAAIKEAK